MGKNRHSKDRLFITATEHKNEYGGKKTKTKHDYQALPFDHCYLSLAPFETPVCTAEGVLFDLVNLVPFVRKHKVNPVSGEPMSPSDIIRLNMAKNADGLWHCPVLFKVFTAHSHIVAIRTTGNVYLYEAVNELNLKIKSFKDLLTDEPFKKSDIITLQNPDDPAHMALRDISNFKHLQTMRDEASAARSSSESSHVRHNPTSDRVMQALKKQQDEKKIADAAAAAVAASLAADQADAEADVANIKALSPTCEDVIPGHTITDQRAGGSLTSSSAGVHTKNFLRPPTADEIREARWSHMRKFGKKAYVQLQTSEGNINLEVHCDWSPRTSWNFLTLCERGYYDDTIFHRLVPGFMVQGGDPTGTGSGGESAWGSPFRDEFDSRLRHDKRGVVSMANSGSNTNGSQFFITMKATPHLDLKHGIFAHVVGGMDCLDRIEKLETKVELETPVSEIKLFKVNVFVNPIKEMEEKFEQTVRDSISSRKKVAIPSATNSISNQKQAIAASTLAIKNADMSFLDTVSSGDTKSSAPPTIGKYMTKSSKKGGSMMEKASTIQKSSKGEGDKASANTSLDDKVAAFLRSQGGGGGTSAGAQASNSSSSSWADEGVPSKKKKKLTGGFHNW
mmetsp:Transcript_19918/g.37057  ORF Transcript_19918/g.37057 Transcript_19918/m.37057 type:complete len:621 (-) Transcript_19918:81-1943(-)